MQTWQTYTLLNLDQDFQEKAKEKKRKRIRQELLHSKEPYMKHASDETAMR